MEIDLTEFTRFRCAVTLDTPDGVPTRVRLLEWSVLNTTFLDKRPKDESATLAEGVVSVLMSSVGHMSPDIVDAWLISLPDSDPAVSNLQTPVEKTWSIC